MEKRSSPESNESIGHIYAEFIDNSEFKTVTNTEADYSIFELTLLTPNTATFKISTNREKLVIARPNYLAGCKKDIESDGEFLITNNAGTAHKSGDKWVIDSPLDIKIVKEKESGEVHKTKNREDKKRAEIEKSIYRENTTPIVGDKIYLKEREGNTFFKEAKNEENGFYVLFNFNGNRASYRFSGNVDRAISNYDAVLKDVFDDSTYTLKATNVINIKDGLVEKDIDGRWKIITPAEIAFVIGDKISGLKKLNNEIIEHINNKYKMPESEKNKTIINDSVESAPKPKDDKQEKQKKIDEVYSEIMEIIRINNESLLKEKELENELAKLITSKKK